MAKKKTALDGIVQPTRAMTPDQLAEQVHLARRSARWIDRNAQARKGFGKGGRTGGRRAAIMAG